MLDHNCQDDEMCSCWCELHDCPLDNCPSYKLVTAWIEQARTEGRKAAAADILRFAEERFHPASGGRAQYLIAAGIAATGDAPVGGVSS